MTKASSIKKESAVWGFWFQRRVYHYQRQRSLAAARELRAYILSYKQNTESELGIARDLRLLNLNAGS